MIVVTSPDIERVAKASKKLRKNVVNAEEKAVGLTLQYLKRRVQEGLRGGTKAKGAKKAVRRRSGGLAGSVNTRTRKTGNAVEGRIGSNAAQAALLDRGGEVVPTKKQWLTIPISDGPAMTGAGVPRGSARDFNLGFFVNPNDPMTAYLVGREDGLLYFVLKKRVTIPEHGWLSGPVRANEKKIHKFIEDEIAKSVKKSGL